MKKIVYFACMAFLLNGCNNPTQTERKPKIDPNADIMERVLTREDTVNAMAMAFAKQESRFNHTAVSSCGRYVGCLQISKICVAEANRLIGEKIFFDGSEGYIDDRLDRQGSYAIFKTIQNHHNPTLDIDVAISLWNKKCPRKYRDSVRRYYAYNLENYETLDNYFEIQ